MGVGRCSGVERKIGNQGWHECKIGLLIVKGQEALADRRQVDELKVLRLRDTPQISVLLGTADRRHANLAQRLDSELACGLAGMAMRSAVPGNASRRLEERQMGLLNATCASRAAVRK
jgi:hypothetical protein